MKYVVILGDGMADEPIMELKNRTPLQTANKPSMDYLAAHGEIGLVKTIPEDMSPGSDTANLSVMGYDPRKYYTGRSPLEAVSMGIPINLGDVTFRANLVTLSQEEPYEEKTLLDHGAGDISTEEAVVLVDYISEHLNDSIKELYPGISYRHLLLWHEGSTEVNLTPPHDIRNRKIKHYLPKGTNADIILNLMKRSNQLLDNHPINLSRKSKGLNVANSLWIWGEGTKPNIDSFYDKYGLKGAMISAVDLLKGIGKSCGLDVIEVEGATGNLHTNYRGKATAAINCLKNGNDFVYVHIEAPDECSHCGELYNKIRSIELIDDKVIKPIIKALDDLKEDYRIMVLPDHPTPIRLCTHTNEPVPFAIYDSRVPAKTAYTYNEIDAKKSKFFINEGHELMDYFVKGGKETC